jgi:alcohol dehydrogenase class IV
MRHVSVDHPHAIMAAKGVERFFLVLEKWPKEIDAQQAIESGHVTMGDLLRLQLSAWHCYFSPASVIYGLSHRIGHILGGTFGVPHSLTSCITLAPVIRACAGFYGDRLTVFTTDRHEGTAAEVLADRVAGLVTALDLPSRIESFGLKKRQLTEIADLLTLNYPDEVGDLGTDSASKLHRLLESLW